MKKVILKESALAEMIKAKLQEKAKMNEWDKGNIYWKHVTPEMKVIDTGHSYTADGKLVNWESRDADKAQRFLTNLAKKEEKIYIPKFHIKNKNVDEDIKNIEMGDVIKIKGQSAVIKEINGNNIVIEFTDGRRFNVNSSEIDNYKNVDEDIEDGDVSIRDTFLSDDPNFKNATYEKVKQIDEIRISLTDEEHALLEAILNDVEADNDKEEKVLDSIKNKLRP